MINENQILSSTVSYEIVEKINVSQILSTILNKKQDCSYQGEALKFPTAF